MKTITQYAPMVFSRMEEYAAQKWARRQRLKGEALAVAGYTVAGLLLSWDLGFAPWEWQFWICFGPFLVATEVFVSGVQRRAVAWDSGKAPVL